MTVLANDPPLAAQGTGFVSAPLADVLACDVVSVHVPLTAAGPYPTRHLLDAAALARMAPGSLLVNAARGGVVDEAALVARLAGPEALLAAIDCWVGEPPARLPNAPGWPRRISPVIPARRGRRRVSLRRVGPLVR